MSCTKSPKKAKILKQVRTYNFIEVTKKEFQPYQSELITDSEATEIQDNLFGVVELLLQWDSNSTIAS